MGRGRRRCSGVGRLGRVAGSRGLSPRLTVNIGRHLGCRLAAHRRELIEARRNAASSSQNCSEARPAGDTGTRARDDAKPVKRRRGAGATAALRRRSRGTSGVAAIAAALTSRWMCANRRGSELPSGIVEREREQLADRLAERRLRRIVAHEARQTGEIDELVVVSPGERGRERGVGEVLDARQQRIAPDPPAADRRPEVERLLARDDALELTARDALQLSRRQTGLQCAAQRPDDRQLRRAERDVGRVEDLARRDLRIERELIGGAEPGGVDEDVREASCSRRQIHARSHTAQCARMKRARGKRAAYSRTCAPSAGIPRPAWIRIGRRSSSASATMSRTAGSSRSNCSARGCSLIPLRAGREAAADLGDTVGRPRVDAAERDQAAVGRGRRLEHVVVGGRVAVGLVHREHDRARSGRCERLEQLVGRALEAVGIVDADVRVRVEQRDRRQQLHRLLAPREQQLVGVHAGQSTKRRLCNSSRKLCRRQAARRRHRLSR